MEIEITKSFSPYKKLIIQELNDLDVVVYEDGLEWEKLEFEKSTTDSIGKYKSTKTPMRNKQYRIQAKSESYTMAKSATSIPHSVIISEKNAKQTDWGGEENINSKRYNFSFTLNDLSTSDYYYFTLAFPIHKLDPVTNKFNFYAFQYAEILTGELPNSQLYLRNGLLFNDEAFNGENYIIQGTATTYSFPSLPDFNDKSSYELDTTNLYLQVHHLSKELYLFYSSHARKLLNDDDLYAESTPIFTNIENGFGIFGGENITKSKIKITQ